MQIFYHLSHQGSPVYCGIYGEKYSAQHKYLLIKYTSAIYKQLVMKFIDIQKYVLLIYP